MIEKELEIIRETERQCREMLAEAERERQRILHAAREEARLLHEDMIRTAREEGMRHTTEEAAQEAANRAERLAEWEQEVARIREQSLPRIEGVVHTIFEGM